MYGVGGGVEWTQQLLFSCQNLFYNSKSVASNNHIRTCLLHLSMHDLMLTNVRMLIYFFEYEFDGIGLFSI